LPCTAASDKKKKKEESRKDRMNKKEDTLDVTEGPGESDLALLRLHRVAELQQVE
jgi:hypothetical protein